MGAVELNSSVKKLPIVDTIKFIGSDSFPLLTYTETFVKSVPSPQRQ